MDTGIPTLADRLVDTDATVRRLAVIDLPYSDEDDIVPLLLPRLADADAQVRTEAIRALEGFECGLDLPLECDLDEDTDLHADLQGVEQRDVETDEALLLQHAHSVQTG